MPKTVYLDYAAATPLDRQVFKAMEPYFSEQFYNPSSTYLAGRQVRSALEAARQSLAASLGSRPKEIVLTAGATEANNLAISGLMRQFPDAEIIVSAIEHESVLAPAGQFNRRLVPVSEGGTIDTVWLKNNLSDKTVLLSLMMVSNEIGAVQPLKEVIQLVKEVRKVRLSSGNKLPLLVHSDVVQAVNYFDLHVSRLGVDMLTINGGKIYGPKQSGLLYLRTGVTLQPLILGGGQERQLRSGTENVPAIIGLAKALELALKNRREVAARIMSLRQQFEKELLTIFPTARINGGRRRAPHIISVTFPGVDNENLMMQLDERGIICGVGSACSAGKEEPSHVLKAIGLSKESARSTLRFSLGKQTTAADTGTCLKVLKALV